MGKTNTLVKNILIFLAIFLVINYLTQSCQTKQAENLSTQGSLVFSTTNTEYSRQQVVTLKLENNTKNAITIKNECPGEPFAVQHYENNEWKTITSNPSLNCQNTKDIELAPAAKLEIPYTSWNHSLFSQMGRFRIEFATTIDGKEKTIESNEFSIVKEGLFKQLWMGVFYRPIYNGLMLLISIMPNFDLGFAIILLTIVIRTILLIPSQKAMRAQKRMQEIQPRIEKIKEKYKDDKQKIAMETMAIWKEAQISPLSSCLPILMQFPFLIALFYVVNGGLNPDNSYLLYSAYGGLTINNINVHFLGMLDLTKINLYVLPLVVGGLQFIQMKLTIGKKPPKVDKDKKDMATQFAAANNMMLYVMPVMIAVFTASMPAGVGLYWGTSTLYGTIQQLFVNKEKDQSKKDEPTVKVITKEDK